MSSSFLEIQLTHQCQMNCTYCTLKRLKPDMSEELLYKSIDFVFTSSSRNLFIQWFGGEPLLRYDLIQKGTAYALKKNKDFGKNIIFDVSTNGLGLSREKIEYFKEHNTGFVYSLDGVEEVQVETRPLFSQNDRPSRYPFARLIKNLRLLVELEPEYFVNMVIAPHKIHLLYESIRWLVEDIHVKYIRISYLIGTVWTEDKKQEFFEAHDRVIEDFGDRVNFIHLQSKDEPCITSTLTTVDTDGKLYMAGALTASHVFPDFEELNFLGHMDDFSSFDALPTDRSLREKALRIYPYKSEVTRELVLNNLQFGYDVSAALGVTCNLPPV